jgi:hypothetical protein
MAVVLVVLGLAVAGCGGSDSGSGSDTEAVATETTSSEETTSTEETVTTEETTSDETTETQGGGVSGVLSEDCAELVSLSSTFAEAFAATASGQSANLDESSKFFEEFADRVPQEIRDDFRIVAQNYSKIAEALKDVGPISASSSAADLAEAAQKLQEATKNIDQAEVGAAATRIGEWASANCNAGG